MARTTRPIVTLLLVVLGACSNGPPIVATGQQESPCRGSFDCVDRHHCVEVDGHAFCTRECLPDCPRGYACDRAAGVCMPVSDGACPQAHERCGPSFAPCCTGTRCVELAPYGTFCEPPCTRDLECDSECCVDMGGGGVCAPTPYCD